MRPYSTSTLLPEFTKCAAIAIGVLCLAMIAGCVTTKGYSRAAATAQRIGDLRTEFEVAKVQINLTTDSLNTLVRTQGVDLRPVYAGFVKNLAQLEAEAAKISAGIDSLQARGEAYYTAWEQELPLITDTDLRARNTERLNQSREQFRAVVSTALEARAAFDPFLVELRDVQRALAYDLNPGGVAAMAPSAEQAEQNGIALKAEIDRAIAELDTLTAAISPVPPVTQ